MASGTQECKKISEHKLTKFGNVVKIIVFLRPYFSTAHIHMTFPRNPPILGMENISPIWPLVKGPPGNAVFADWNSNTFAFVQAKFNAAELVIMCTAIRIQINFKTYAFLWTEIFVFLLLPTKLVKNWRRIWATILNDNRELNKILIEAQDFFYF